MSRPYYRASRGHWAARINGKQRVLVKGPENKATRAKAWAEFNRLTTQGELAKGTVKELINAYWNSLQEQLKTGQLEESTVTGRRPVLMSFGRRLGRMKVAALKPHHVETWLAEDHPDTNSTTRNTRIGWIKRLFSWGVEMGLIDHSPIAKMKRPPALTRQDFIPPDQWPTLLEACTPQELRDAVEFALHTGQRVQELYRLEAKYHQPGRFTLPIQRSKGKKQSRVIWYPSALIPMVDRLSADTLLVPSFAQAVEPPGPRTI